MSVTLPLDQMTLPEKLQTLENLWDDLCRNAKSVPSPEWHGEILKDREASIEQGKERFTDWEEAKRGIRESIS